jgi:hypothetical protein
LGWAMLNLNPAIWEVIAGTDGEAAWRAERTRGDRADTGRGEPRPYKSGGPSPRRKQG